MEVHKESIIRLVIETWRFRRIFDRLLTRLEPNDQIRYQTQLRWFDKKLEEFLGQFDWHIVDVEGHSFDTGMAATPLNIEDFDIEDSLIVDRVLEPIIMGNEGLVKTGTVTVKREES